MQKKYVISELVKCPSCNAYQDSQNATCPNCEHDLSKETPIEIKSPLPTRWLSFYSYVFLPFRIVTSFVPTLAEYDKLIEQGYAAKLNPMLFVPIIAWDIFLCFIIYGLHKRKVWGWTCNWVFLVLTVLISPIRLNMTIGSYLVAVILLSALFFLPNYVYFRKRRILFD